MQRVLGFLVLVTVILFPCASQATRLPCPLDKMPEPPVFHSTQFRKIPPNALTEGRNTLINHLVLVIEQGGAEILKQAHIDDIFSYSDELDAILRVEYKRLLAVDPAQFLREYADPETMQSFLQSPGLQPETLRGLSGVSPTGKQALAPNSRYLALGEALAQKMVDRLRLEGKLP